MKVIIDKCKECGKRHEGSWMEKMSKTLIENQLCFNCQFWFEKLKIKDKPKTVRINNNHYSIGNENAPQYGFRGYGGSKFKIKFFDGRIVETTNLWHQGEIPERYRERLPDNAEFIREERKKKC